MSQATVQTDASSCRGRRRWPDAWRAAAVCAGLVLGVALVFGQALRYGFLSLDDALYVYDEPHVAGGYSWSNVVWAVTKGPAGDWCPLAMLSHMLDCQLFGLAPTGHHFTNLLLHAASAVTLFLVLWRMTAGLWPSALVAALFALHPLRAESVVWIAERRDMLSGLCFMLTLAAYTEYVRRPPSPWRYLVVVAMFALGLLAKPMLVTLPPLLLLLDFWPLERFGSRAVAGVAGARRSPAWRLVVEKLPLFALALADIGMTLSSHRVRAPNPVLTFSERLANAAVSYVAYLGQLIVPADLSIFYSYPEAGWPAWQVAAAMVLLLAITAAAVTTRRSYPYVFVGWFWYVGMLLPVVQIIPFGTGACADRFTYLSQIGLTIALVWGAMRLTATWPARRWILSVGAVLVLAILMACAWRQTGYWQNDETLWKHALDCDGSDVTAHYQLALAWKGKDPAAAKAQCRLALPLAPGDRDFYYGTRARACALLGEIATREGNTTEAWAWLDRSIAIYPNSSRAHLMLGNLLVERHDFDEGSFISAAAPSWSRPTRWPGATWPGRWPRLARSTTRLSLAARPPRSIPIRASPSGTWPLIWPRAAGPTRRSLICAAHPDRSRQSQRLLFDGQLAARAGKTEPGRRV